MPRDTKRVPDLLLERLVTGDLPAGEASEVRARLSAEPDGEARLAELAADDAATLLLHPPGRVAEEVRRRAGRPAGRAAHGWRLVPALAAAALAVVVAVPLLRQETERVKGLAPALVLHRRTAEGAEVLGAGAVARPGDLLQVGYVAGGAPYGVIVSIDGAGAVTRHWPQEGQAAAPLSSGREVLLPESYRLDDAPGFERFLLVTGPDPFPVDAVIAAARELAARPDASTAHLALEPGLAQSGVLLTKESRP